MKALKYAFEIKWPLKILDVSNLKPGNITMGQPREVVLIGHDMAENGYSSQIQKLVTSIYSKRPNSDVYSIDWSELVSFCITGVLTEVDDGPV